MQFLNAWVSYNNYVTNLSRRASSSSKLAATMNTQETFAVHEVMKSTLLCFFSVLVAMFCVAAPLQSQAAVAALHLADYDAELRRPDGRVDTTLMIQRL